MPGEARGCKKPGARWGGIFSKRLPESGGEQLAGSLLVFPRYSSPLAPATGRLSASIDLAPLFLASARWKRGCAEEAEGKSTPSARIVCQAKWLSFISRWELFAIVGDGKGSRGFSRLLSEFHRTPMEYVNTGVYAGRGSRGRTF